MMRTIIFDEIDDFVAKHFLEGNAALIRFIKAKRKALRSMTGKSTFFDVHTFYISNTMYLSASLIRSSIVYHTNMKKNVEA